MTPAVHDPDEIRRRVRELGDWFHNLDLGGVRTAPDHFLGDYPSVKWRRFAHAVPADLSGKSVLDVGCNGGFYSIEMKRRGAARVVGADRDERYLAQARFAAEVCGADVEFVQLDVYDVAALGERFDVVLFMGVLYHLRHPLLALDLLHEHVVGDTLVFQSLLARVARSGRGRARLSVLRARSLLARGLSAHVLHRARLRRRSHQLVDSQSRLRRSDAALRRLSHHRSPRGRSVHLPKE